MISVSDAFAKFRSRLELTDREQADASRRQKKIREIMNLEFKIAEDFLTGSYSRWTKTKPLKDVDIFCVLHDDERAKYRSGKHPSVILNEVHRILVEEYGRDNVKKQRRSVSVVFPRSDDPDIVMSVDVVPAFTKGDHYEIADEATASGWTETNPTIHADKATDANKRFDLKWKGLVRMFKAWNQEKGKPVKPSFLLEVMCLDIIRPPFGGDYPYEFMGLFSTAATRIFDTWPDPAGLGPPVSDSMDQAARNAARDSLNQASAMVREAIQLGKAGKNMEALQKYRELFGDLFPLS